MSNYNLYYTHFENIKFRQVLKNLGISSAYMYAMKNNKAWNLPYHNMQHCTAVAKTAYDIYCAEKIGRKDYNSHDELIYLLVAAIFHDFNHKGKDANSDKENIGNALQGVIDYNETLCLDKFNASELTIIFETIKCTEFPFIYTPYSYSQKVIRDADILCNFNHNNINNIFFGLLSEINGKLDKPIETLDFIDEQIDFISSVEMFTEYGNNIMPSLVDNAKKLYSDFKNSEIEIKKTASRFNV